MDDRYSYDFRTYSNIYLLTAHTRTLHLASLIISITAANLYLLIYFFSGYSFSLQPLIISLVIMATSYLACLVVKKEYILMINRNLQHRPPVQYLILFLSCYAILFFSLPGQINTLAKTSPIVIAVSGIISLVLALILQKMYSFLFSRLMHLINRTNTKPILDQEVFTEVLTHKFNEAKRYSNKFSLILISFTYPKQAENKIKRSLILTLFYNIIKSNIRTTDTMGLLMRVQAAAVISNNNDKSCAEIQARRLIKILKRNQILSKKIKFYDASYKCGICEFNSEMEDRDIMILRGRNALKEALATNGLDIAVK